MKKLSYLSRVVILAIAFIGLSKSSTAHSVQFAYCANCASTLRLFFEHWHGCTPNPATSGTITISLTVGANTTTTTGFPSLNLCNIPFSGLPGCNLPPVFVASCPANANVYNDWWVYDFPNVPCGVPISVTASNPSNAYTADCGGMFPASFSLTIPCNVNKPFANFSVSADTVCLGQAISFTDLSTGGNPGLTYQWDFNDGSPLSTAQNPTHTYAAPGTYCVRLDVAKQSGGCLDDTTICVTVLGTPVININNPAICAGQSATLTANAAPGGGTYNWTPGGMTTQSITVTPGATTTYTLNYVSPGGCAGSQTATVTVNPQPVATLQNYVICTGQSVTLNPGAQPGGSTFLWTPGGQTTPTITVNPPVGTTYTVTVTGPGGCTDTASAFVQIGSNPVVTIPNDTVCAGQAGTLVSQVSNPGGTYTWAPTGATTANITQTPGATTTYTLTYNNNGCIGTGTGTIVVNPQPTITLTGGAICAGQNITLTPGGNPAGGTYSWQPGGMTGASVTVSPATTTTYTATVTAPGGCQATASAQVVVNALPVCQFTYDTVCFGDVTSFFDQSSVQGSNITGWQWVFGDGSPVDNTANPTHQYAAPGTYTVTLIVTSAQGCTGTMTHQVTVNDNPTASFNVGNVCIYDPALFNNTSTITTGTITGYAWNFGGPGTSTQTNPSQMYPTPGTYTVQLIAYAGTGCSDTVTAPVVIHPKPNAAFNFTAVCVGNPTPVVDNSTITTGTINGWSYNNSTGTSNNQNPTFTFPTAGNHNTTLIVTSDQGCTDTVMVPIKVNAVPIVDFVPTHVCDGNPNQFTNLTTVPNGTPQNYVWSFGSAQPSPSHQFPGAGSYQVTLVVSSTDGCIDSITKPVHVHPNPVVDFVGDVLDGCETVCTNFTNNTTITSGNIAIWAWNFNNGSTSNLQNPTECFTNEGTSLLTFDVTLTATSDSGCVTTVTKPSYVSVYPMPIASFNPNPDLVKISDAEITFNNNSIGAQQSSWNFGDGIGTSTAHSPSYTYPDSGTYTVWLWIENQWGCRDSTWKNVRVDPEFFIYIPNAFTPKQADGVNDRWRAKYYGVEEANTYIFDRWGELIWEGHQLDSSWDGKYNGEMAKTDTYVYLIQLKTVLGDKKEYRGKVTLLR